MSWGKNEDGSETGEENEMQKNYIKCIYCVCGGGEGGG